MSTRLNIQKLMNFYCNAAIKALGDRDQSKGAVLGDRFQGMASAGRILRCDSGEIKSGGWRSGRTAGRA